MQFVFEICCIVQAAEIDPCELIAVCIESQLCRASAKCIKSYNITLQMMIPFPFFLWNLQNFLFSLSRWVAFDQVAALVGTVGRSLWGSLSCSRLGSRSGGLCQLGGDPPNREHQENSPKPVIGLISFGFVTRVRDALL